MKTILSIALVMLFSVAIAQNNQGKGNQGKGKMDQVHKDEPKGDMDMKKVKDRVKNSDDDERPQQGKNKSDEDKGKDKGPKGEKADKPNNGRSVGSEDHPGKHRGQNKVVEGREFGQQTAAENRNKNKGEVNTQRVDEELDQVEEAQRDADRKISEAEDKLKRQRDNGEISNEEYEEKAGNIEKAKERLEQSREVSQETRDKVRKVLGTDEPESDDTESEEETKPSLGGIKDKIETKE